MKAQVTVSGTVLAPHRWWHLRAGRPVSIRWHAGPQGPVTCRA
jgi:hypothetical protein